MKNPVTSGINWFFLICFIILSFSVFASEIKVPLATGEWLPYTSEKLESYGFFTEIVSTVLKEAGLEPQYEFFSWKRCFEYVKEGEVFAAFPYSKTVEREKVVHFSDTVALSKTVFFYNKQDQQEVTFAELQDLKPYVIGGVDGYFYKEMLKQANLNVSYVESEELLIKQLYHNRVELVPMNDLVGWNLIKKLYPNEVNRFGTLQKPLSTNKLHLIVSKKYPDSIDLMKKFNQALKDIRQKGVYQRILKKYNVGE